MSTLLTLVDVTLVFVALLLAVPAGVLALQIFAADRTRPVDPPAIPELKIGVLMPAHDEALGIAAAVTSVRAQLAPGDRLLVVADNCQDDTADIAAAAGAEVVERCESTRRGKGYALDHGMRYYERAPVDVVVIVDADCELQPGALRALASTAVAHGRPSQALYLMCSPEGAGVKTHVAEFAWRVRNQVRPMGCLALGWPCQLMGTGMAFPWATIVRAPLASGHLVEDMELGLALARDGTPPLFCPSARVVSRFASEEQGGRSQRTRWEHGHLAMIASRGLPMLWQGLARRQASLAALALDLCVPPLASLVLAQATLVIIAAVWAMATGAQVPLVLASVSGVATAAAIVRAWRHHGREVLPPRELAAIPAYVLGKLPIYFAWFTRRQTEWVRTKRSASMDDRP